MFLAINSWYLLVHIIERQAMLNAVLQFCVVFKLQEPQDNT